MTLISETPPLMQLRMQEARKLFGLAVKTDPDAFYNMLVQPKPAQLPVEVQKYVGAEYARTTGAESEALDLLMFGVADTQTFILNIMQHHPSISFERAVEIAQHERTITALAVVARQSSEVSRILIDHPGDSYDLSSDKAAIEVVDSVQPSLRRGCPAVEITGPSVEPWPIFSRFAPWAAKLALISYYDHKED